VAVAVASIISVLKFGAEVYIYIYTSFIKIMLPLSSRAVPKTLRAIPPFAIHSYRESKTFTNAPYL
jgi:hypothetical protein